MPRLHRAIPPGHQTPGEHQMSGSESSPEFERKLQEIGAKSAHMIIPRSEVQHTITELRYPAWEEETPMTDSEELFALICGRTTTKAVERILAAGYRRPRTIATVAELDALPDGVIIMDARASCREGLKTMGSGNVWRAMGPATVLRSPEIALPATVLHEPEATK
ncbi:hypothetical protein ArV2_gp46 [Arthrobacter phage vB_ArS-ArV2]|uniref:Uncharacterized protein n=1 Tax=Arthrobacter phage vB_ArS-ArV2 TaxID=1414742 RepID=V5R9C1_9CAUD|nr:hypothetical protein ArV2_gp46 [Arthrobacter phage vB_ArS-ArV2]AHB31657.1 hypothetical protein ArV2_gp46 [Arthrobacter phage vB_ArS-ArV2]